jgi:hypothetical protein
MITVTAGTSDPLIFTASLHGAAVYLDSFAIKALAKGDPTRRRRFVDSIHMGAELLFSVANAAELSGPKENSFDIIKNFLNDLGAHWYPVELNILEVVKREAEGASRSECCLSAQFMRDCIKIFMRRYGDLGGIIDLSEDFFRLGPVMDWVASQRESIARGKAQFDEMLRTRIRLQCDKRKNDPEWMERNYPRLPFKQSSPATFVFINLNRILILEAKSHQLKKGDGIDLSHAVMASAFAKFGVIDKHWKRRIAALPTPNQLARIYYELELDQMIDDIEAATQARSLSST